MPIIMSVVMPIIMSVLAVGGGHDNNHVDLSCGWWS